MQGTATVLIVSLGDAPEGLRHELSRLGVRIVPCAFSDAEECIDSESPDLIVLMGVLGAMELAMLIEDQALDTSARMVIVAERKELAKLRGLNREIVISLFATETTERVVAHRIESLARRAVRRRLYGNSMAPTPSMGQRDASGVLPGGSEAKPAMDAPAPDFIVDSRKSKEEPEKVEARVPSDVPLGASLTKNLALGSGSDQKTSMGLPSGKPGSRIPLKVPGLPEAPPDSAHEPVAKAPEAPRRESGARPDPLAATAVHVSSPLSAEARKKPPLPEAQRSKPALPSQKAAALSARDTDEDEKGPDSLVVIDDELLESLPPSDVPESTQAAAIQSIPALPTFLPSSIPPELPEEAKAEAPLTSRGTVKLKQGDLDVTEALSALDELERFTPAEEKAEGPSVEIAEDEPSEPTGRGSAPEIEVSVPVAEERPGAADSERSGEKEELLEAKSKSTAEAPSASALKPASKSPSKQKPESQSSRKQYSRPPSSAAAPGAVSSGSLSKEDVSRLVGDSKRPAKGGKVWGVLGVVAMGAIGVAIGLRQTAQEESAAPEETPAAIEAARGQAALKELPAPGVAAGEAIEEAAEAVQPAEPQEGESPEPEPGDTENAEAEKAEEAVPEEVEQALSPTLNMENPFRVKDGKMPTCDELVSENPVKDPTDPIQAASGVWDEARKAIVSGRVEKAHIFMCQAVALNPESAAVEGLAHHYMRGRSVEQSLVWTEKADALRPGQLEIANLRGDIYGMMGDTEKAKATWLQALGVPPTETGRILSISKDYAVDAGRHLRRGDLVLAELWYRRAVILNPENLTGLVGLAKTYQRAEMPEYARAFCELSLRVSDVVPEVHVLLGELALADGNKIEAKQRFERALKVRPDFFPARRGLRQAE